MFLSAFIWAPLLSLRSSIVNQDNLNRKAESLLKIKSVSLKTALPKSTIYLKISQDEFPAPIFLGKRSVAWLESEVDNWIEQRVQDSRRQGGKSHG
jgi:prophage regulatory protein